MRLRMLFFISGAIFVAGCSSSPKQQPAVVTVAVTSTVPAKSEIPAKVVAPKNEMTCKRHEESRLLEIESRQPKGCSLWYTRYDIRTVVASSVLGNAYCEKVRENIRTNLVGAGFECMNIQ